MFGLALTATEWIVVGVLMYVVLDVLLLSVKFGIVWSS